MNYILTSFESFNGRKENVSSLVCEKIYENYIKKIVLPVSWRETPIKVKELLKLNPDFLILTGEAGNRTKVSIEYVAINLMNANISDNDGVLIKNKKIDDGNDAYFSNYDCIELVNLINEKYDCGLSLTAGSYICNLSYYIALRDIMENKLKTKVIFVHFPGEYKDEYVLILQEIIKKLGEKYGITSI